MLRCVTSRTTVAAALALAVGLSGQAAGQDPDPAGLPALLEAEGLGRLAGAFEAAGLGTALGDEELTVLAPSDDAFAALGHGALESLLGPGGRPALERLLRGHVLRGRLPSKLLVSKKAAPTLAGRTLTFTVRDGRPAVATARFRRSDVPAGRFLVHVIDRVLVASDVASDLAGLRRARALAILSRALDGEDGARRTAAAAREAARFLGPRSVLGDRLVRAAASSSGAPELLARIDGVRRDLGFQPLIEAPLPEGFPAPTPVGEVELKHYPAHRLARTAMDAGPRSNRAFYRLFEHIKRERIAMTAPVQVDAGGAGAETMAFLYRSRDLGEVGRDGAVEVVDVAPVTVASLGLRGSRDPRRVSAARELILAWVGEQQGLEPAGGFRTMGYNSPMVPADRRFFEVQLPVHEQPVRARD